MSQWNFWIDRGGTFIDVIGRDPQGGLQAGAPAGPEFNGASGVNTQMTNCRLTDPEILKTRSPVVLEQFSIRRGLGGRAVTRLATARDAPSIFSRRWNAQFSAVIAASRPSGWEAGKQPSWAGISFGAPTRSPSSRRRMAGLDPQSLTANASRAGSGYGNRG
jgi:N-methylhydantoinase B/oxoprolinase/acetone carboxylase alpha subunit